MADSEVGTWRCKEDGGEIRVMAVAEGWAMARHKGAMPFVLMIKELRQEYEFGRPVVAESEVRQKFEAWWALSGAEESRPPVKGENTCA